MARELVIGSGLGSTTDSTSVTIYATTTVAASVPVADTGGYYVGTNVEAVLRELAEGGDGATWLSGNGPPSNSLGSNRDFYLDNTNKAYYGPKAYGSWGAAKTLVGPTGPVGPAATVAVGTVTTGAAGSSATVTNAGTSGAAVLNFGIPRGDTGVAATVGVGTVTTGTPGTSAVVTNAGTSGAAVLNFTIPRGDTGATGPVGPIGPANYIILNQFFI